MYLMIVYSKFGESLHVIKKEQKKDFVKRLEDFAIEITVLEYIGLHERNEDIIFEYLYEDVYGPNGTNFVPIQQIANYELPLQH